MEALPSLGCAEEKEESSHTMGGRGTLRRDRTVKLRRLGENREECREDQTEKSLEKNRQFPAITVCRKSSVRPSLSQAQHDLLINSNYLDVIDILFWSLHLELP
ncbi:hypothetical protein HPB48_016464 [Haemaphysalis longicornis]|uniref:Uncharacterized protein n=1 Tax=Haemaphysalis longicornis TaxID=44386 RepID=A0A9J6GUC7_HAELO|nr:hypothetical protein HPB48_016464 [Haemaphysalis longicornis]